MNVIGYDCEGRPLHVGDRVVLIEATNPHWFRFLGKTLTLLGKDNLPGYVRVAEFRDEGAATATKRLRKLPDDQHKASDQSFGELLSGLKLNQRAVA